MPGPCTQVSLFGDEHDKLSDLSARNQLLCVCGVDQCVCAPVIDPRLQVEQTDKQRENKCSPAPGSG